MVRTIAFLFWLFLLVLSVPYVRRVKHSKTQTFAAALMFVMLVSVVSGSLFFALSWAVISMGWAHALADPLWAIVFVAGVFLPGFLFARWMIKRPPWNRPVPK